MHRSTLTIFLTMLSAAGNAQVPIGLTPLAAHSSDRETVAFVTARAVEHDRKAFDYYGAGRGELSAGECAVDLDATKKRQIVGLQALGIDEVVDRFLAAGGRVTVYVHGYNVSFEEACRQAAFLEHRLALEDRLLFFSWPAEAKVMGYLGDMGDVEWSVLPLRKLLLMLVDHYGPGTVDVIGHSLGARAVVEAVTGVGAIRGANTLGRIILIAPDLDADVFVRDYIELREGASVIAVYVSPQDRALKASRNVRDQARLGEGRADLSGLPQLEVIEVTQSRWRWGARHEYHLNNGSVIDDLRGVLSGPPHESGSRIIAH